MGIENEKPDLRFDMKGRAILKRDAAYTSGEKRCNLCLKEKLCSMKAGQKTLLNERSEIISDTGSSTDTGTKFLFQR